MWRRMYLFGLQCGNALRWLWQGAYSFVHSTIGEDWIWINMTVMWYLTAQPAERLLWPSNPNINKKKKVKFCQRKAKQSSSVSYITSHKGRIFRWKTHHNIYNKDCRCCCFNGSTYCLKWWKPVLDFWYYVLPPQITRWGVMINAFRGVSATRQRL